MFVELPPEDYQPGDEHMCGLLRCSLYGTRDAAQNWEEELASTLGDLGLTRGRACPCVWRGRIKGEDIVATVHGDDVTIGGQRSAVEPLIKMISKKYEIKKQVLGGDPDLEKSGRILNRVTGWDRDGITVEADQRHVREIMKGLELERGSVFRRGLGRRQGHSEISLRRGHHERRTLSQGVDKEAASGIAVFRRE